MEHEDGSAKKDDEEVAKGSKERRGRSPTLSQVVDWTSLLLDAHFTTLLLSYKSQPTTNATLSPSFPQSPPAHVLLLSLHKLVLAHAAVCEGAGNLKGVLKDLWYTYSFYFTMYIL